MKLDVEQIYDAHMQCEGEEFLLEMIREGLQRFKDSNDAELKIKGLIYETFN
tara:strand:- start:319 stop:474 length:156 start_codon:yes stop_codon:yes gene_type:complete